MEADKSDSVDALILVLELHQLVVHPVADKYDIQIDSEQFVGQARTHVSCSGAEHCEGT